MLIGRVFAVRNDGNDASEGDDRNFGDTGRWGSRLRCGLE
jgi:hypothetical protein